MFTINGKTAKFTKAYAIYHRETQAPNSQDVLRRLEANRSSIRQLVRTDDLIYPIELSPLLKGVTDRPLWLFKINHKVIFATPCHPDTTLATELRETLGPTTEIQDLHRQRAEIEELHATFEREFSPDVKKLPLSPDQLTIYQVLELLSIGGHRNLPAKIRLRFEDVAKMSSLFGDLYFRGQKHPESTHLCFNFRFPYRLRGWKMPEKPALPELKEIHFVDYRKKDDNHLVYDAVFELDPKLVV
jgi:hypothetical protein